ncbi:unnamed protein product [Ixodes persulcatus]
MSQLFQALSNHLAQIMLDSLVPVRKAPSKFGSCLCNGTRFPVPCASRKDWIMASSVARYEAPIKNPETEVSSQLNFNSLKLNDVEYLLLRYCVGEKCCF